MRVALVLALVGSSFVPARAAERAAPAPRLTAEQVVEKNVAARGGLEAWRAVHTLTFAGKLDAGGRPNVELPFRMDLGRTRKSRLEIQFGNSTAVQVYDGKNGWKLRPFLGRRDIVPFSNDELQSAALEADLDGFLVDHAAKGITVALEGIDKVDGHDAYRLALGLRDGSTRRVWIDCASFLERRIEGVPRRMDGKQRAVDVYLRDYRPEHGLVVPHEMVSSVSGAKGSHKLTIESVEVNPVLDESRFTRAGIAIVAAATGDARAAKR